MCFPHISHKLVQRGAKVCAHNSSLIFLVKFINVLRNISLTKGSCAFSNRYASDSSLKLDAVENHIASALVVEIENLVEQVIY